MKRDTSIQNWLLLSAYLDGELPDASRSRLEKRLEHDAALRDELLSLRQLKTILHNAPRKKVPRNFTLIAEMVKSRSMPVLFPVFSTMSVLSAILFALIFVTQLLPLSKTTPYDYAAESQTIVEPEMLEAPNLAVQPSGGIMKSEASADESLETTAADEVPAEEEKAAEIMQEPYSGSGEWQSESAVPQSMAQPDESPLEEATERIAEDMPSGVPLDKTESTDSGMVHEQPVPTILSSQEDVNGIPPQAMEMKSAPEEDALAEPAESPPANANILRNTFALTQTGPVQQQTPEVKNVSKRNMQHILLLEITTALVALVSGWAAYQNWKQHRI